MSDALAEIAFTVGYPPAKNEALSMLGAGHPHLDRVRVLLEAARVATIAGGRFSASLTNRVGLERAVRTH